MIETRLLQITNRKLDTLDQLTMTLSDLEGHFVVSRLFDYRNYSIFGVTKIIQ